MGVKVGWRRRRWRTAQRQRMLPARPRPQIRFGGTRPSPSQRRGSRGLTLVIRVLHNVLVVHRYVAEHAARPPFGRFVNGILGAAFWPWSDEGMGRDLGGEASPYGGRARPQSERWRFNLLPLSPSHKRGRRGECTKALMKCQINKKRQKTCRSDFLIYFQAIDFSKKPQTNP